MTFSQKTALPKEVGARKLRELAQPFPFQNEYGQHEYAGRAERCPVSGVPFLIDLLLHEIDDPPISCFTLLFCYDFCGFPQFVWHPQSSVKGLVFCFWIPPRVRAGSTMLMRCITHSFDLLEAKNSLPSKLHARSNLVFYLSC